MLAACWASHLLVSVVRDNLEERTISPPALRPFWELTESRYQVLAWLAYELCAFHHVAKRKKGYSGLVQFICPSGTRSLPIQSNAIIVSQIYESMCHLTPILPVQQFPQQVCQEYILAMSILSDTWYLESQDLEQKEVMIWSFKEMVHGHSSHASLCAPPFSPNYWWESARARNSLLLDLSSICVIYINSLKNWSNLSKGTTTKKMTIGWWNNGTWRMHVSEDVLCLSPPTTFCQYRDKTISDCLSG